MKLQYVFGNPSGKKRRKAVAKKKAKAKKKKNPEKMSYKLVQGKGKKKKTVARGSTGVYPRASEITQLRADVKKLQERKKATKDRTAKKKLQVDINAAKNILKKMQDQRKKAVRGYKMARQSAKESGIDGRFSTEYEILGAKRKKKKGKKVAKKKKSTRKRKTRKKASSKKKSTTRKRRRKKASSKKKSTTRKRRRKKASSKKKSTTRKRRKKASSKKKRRSSKKRRARSSGTMTLTAPATKRRKKRRVKVKVKVNPKYKRNPIGGTMNLTQPLKLGALDVTGGYALGESLSLVAGGVTYGAVNRYLAPMIEKTPLAPVASFAGGTLLNLLAGIALHEANQRFLKNNKALSMLADGMIGASAVGMGVVLGQQLTNMVGGGGFPGGSLRDEMRLDGVDYIPNIPGAQSDFGGVDYTPEMSGVDYTPEMMGGVDFTAGPSLPGHNPDVDFGAYEESAADFGQIPQGLS